MHTLTVGMVGTYPPTRCGIASFTESLTVALRDLPLTQVSVIRVVSGQDATESDKRDQLPWSAELVNGDAASIATAAQTLNVHCDAVVVQHEFGIYGGPDGAEVLQLLSQLRAPVILVLHTVLDHPTLRQRSIIEQACMMAATVVVMSDDAARVLLTRYAVNARAVRVIPHGVFTVPRLPIDHQQDPTVTMLTWGLLGPGKGIEWAIMALALLDGGAGDLQYRVVGQTHPRVREKEGEAYRQMLVRLAGELQVADQVHFVDDYLDRQELAHEIAGADVVLLPYDSRVQATSGVLAEALSARVPVIATRFPYAREMIPHGQGWLVPHEDPRALASAIDRARAQALGAARVPWPSRFRAASADWHDVARMYRRLADRLTASASASARS